MIPVRERRREGGRAVSADGPRPQGTHAGPRPTLFIKIPRGLGKKRNIRATQSVSPVPYVALRPLLLWLRISTFSPAFAFSPSSHRPSPRGTLPLTASLAYSRPLLSLSFSRPPFSCIARDGTYSEDRRGGGALEKDSVAHPPMSFGRFKPHFGIKPSRGVDGSGRIRAFVDFTTFENHSRASFTALNTLTPSHRLICYTKTPSRHFSGYEDVSYHGGAQPNSSHHATST